MMIQPARIANNLVQQHLQALHVGSEVTRWFRKEREPNVIDVTPENVIKALHRVGINCVLMGTHGINGYRSEARASQDVDVLVTKKDIPKAMRVLEEAFPYLQLYDSQVVTRFVDPVRQKVLIDLMKPASRALQVVFRHTLQIGKTHRIPVLEMAVLSKFLAMTSPNRREAKRMVDLGDFIDIVETNRAALDLAKLKRLGDQFNPRVGDKLLRLVEDVDAGRSIHL